MNSTPENISASSAQTENPLKFDTPIKKKNTYTITHGVFALLALIVGSPWYRWVFVYSPEDIFGAYKALPIAVFTAVFVIYCLSFYHARKIPLSSDSYLLLAALMLYAARFFLYPDNTRGEIFGISLLVIHFTALLFIRSVGRPNLIDRIVGDSARAIFDPFASFGALILSFGAFFKPVKERNDKAKTKKLGKEAGFVVLGVIIAIPLLTVIVSLLSSDSFFDSFLGGIFDFFAELDLKLYKVGNYFNIITVLVSLYIFGALYSSDRKRTEAPEAPIANRIIPQTVITTVNVVLIFVYLLFALAQIDGIASIIMQKVPEGLTYADFARSGFFDLCKVACINGAVLYYSEIMKVKPEGKKQSKLLEVLVVVFTFFLIFTAASKMILYISAYGFTPKRFYTLWFMLLLLVIFSLVLVRFKKPDFNLSRYSVYVTLVMLVILLLIDFYSISEALNSAYFPKAVLRY